MAVDNHSKPKGRSHGNVKEDLVVILKGLTPVLGEIGDIRRIRQDMKDGFYDWYQGPSTNPPPGAPGPSDRFVQCFLARYAILGFLAGSVYGIYKIIDDPWGPLLKFYEDLCNIF